MNISVFVCMCVYVFEVPVWKCDDLHRSEPPPYEVLSYDFSPSLPVTDDWENLFGCVSSCSIRTCAYSVWRNILRNDGSRAFVLCFFRVSRTLRSMYKPMSADGAATCKLF